MFYVMVFIFAFNGGMLLSYLVYDFITKMMQKRGKKI